MPERWTAETIPAPLVAILDERAGQEHSAGGSVRQCLADILNRYDELRDDWACALAEEALAADGYDADEQRETVAALMPLQMEAIAARERLVHENPALAAQIRRGIDEAERGETVDRGSFAQYVGEDDDD